MCSLSTHTKGEKQQVGGAPLVLLTRRSRNWRCFAGGVRQRRRALVEEQPEERIARRERERSRGTRCRSSWMPTAGEEGGQVLAFVDACAEEREQWVVWVLPVGTRWLIWEERACSRLGRGMECLLTPGERRGICWDFDLCIFFCFCFFYFRSFCCSDFAYDLILY